MRCVDCKFHKAFPTTNIHWCEATKKHRRISDEDAYVDAPCKVADRKTEPQTYMIDPQEPTNDDKCFECDDFFVCGGQCNKVEDEPQK